MNMSRTIRPNLVRNINYAVEFEPAAKRQTRDKVCRPAKVLYGSHALG